MARWYQAAVGYPFLRNHAASGTADQEPWRFGESFLNVIRTALHLRMQLLPHLYTPYNPMRYDDAKTMEVEVAIDLREGGWGVWQA